MKNFLLFCLIIVFFSCEEDQKIQRNNDGFINYISLNEKTFKDGEFDFYPMVMNYSMDIHNAKNNQFFATPRAGYHPKYDEENILPWGNNSLETHKIIQAHFYSISDMGFNSVRLTGFTATDFYKGFHTWGNVDISNSDEGNKNIKEGLVPLMKDVIKMAEKANLRVILLLSAIETQSENTNNFYYQVAKELKNEKALMAYDLFNEPLYFDRGEYTKTQTTSFVQGYNQSIKKGSSNHLTTIGLSHYKIVDEWDPELMDVDFLSFHIYPYGSRNLSLLERFEAKLYWVQENITKPWIVGETGLNTAENCDPLNYSSGTIEDQLYFMSYSLNKYRSAGASGYSWWSYQDMDFKPGQIEGTCSASCYGLVNNKEGKYYLNSKKDTIIGELKHDIQRLPFKEFLEEKNPYNVGFGNKLPMPSETVFYNIDYLPPHHHIKGRVIGSNGKPIKHAIVKIYNEISKSTYTTFTKPDGTFNLKTGWTNVLTKLNFKIKVTAVKMETVEIMLKNKYLGNGRVLDDITLKPVIKN